MITDTAAVKPDDWLEDEPELIPDPEAEKPEEWDVSFCAPLSDGTDYDRRTRRTEIGCRLWSRTRDVKRPLDADRGHSQKSGTRTTR